MYPEMGVSHSKYSIWILWPDRAYFDFFLQCPVSCIILKAFSFRKYFSLLWSAVSTWKRTRDSQKRLINGHLNCIYFHITWIICVIYIVIYMEKKKFTCKKKKWEGNFLELRKLFSFINIKIIHRMSFKRWIFNI